MLPTGKGAGDAAGGDGRETGAAPPERQMF